MNIEKNFVAEKLPQHEEHSSKSEIGKTLIVAGSENMLGSAIFATGGAMRSGAGLVYLCTEPKVQVAVQSWVPEVVYTTWDKAMSSLSGYDAVGFGSGMGKNHDTYEKLKYLLKGYPKTIVIDADGLNVLAENEELKELVRKRSESGFATILTPHFKEAQRLKGISPAKDKGNRTSGRFGHDVVRRGLAKQLFEQYKAVIVMKGAGTIVYQGGDYFVNTTGNVGMATAGSGDVLTGIITSLASQGLPALDAAICGVYVHGMAGDRVTEEVGVYGTLARDIMEKVALALKALK